MLQAFTTDNPDRGSNSEEHWPTFAEILYRLHQEGVYIRASDLAAFMLAHGLPVDLQYVPSVLQKKATIVNANYQGDMARLSEQPDDYFWYVSSLE